MPYHVPVLFQYDWFFSSWDVDDHVPYDEDELIIPVSGMNQELLNKAHVLGMETLVTLTLIRLEALVALTLIRL